VAPAVRAGRTQYTPAMIPKLTRRSAVAMATIGVLAGCSGGGTGPAGARRIPGEPGVAEQEQAVRDSTALLARYDAVAAAHPSLAARLAPLRAETARHVRAFGGTPPAPSPTATPTPTPSASRSPTPSATATPSPSPTASSSAPGAPAVPRSSAKALASLASAERALADRRAAVLLDVPGGLARLMASVAAAGAGHVVLLGSPDGT